MTYREAAMSIDRASQAAAGSCCPIGALPISAPPPAKPKRTTLALERQNGIAMSIAKNITGQRCRAPFMIEINFSP